MTVEGTPRASVIVRTKDKADTVEATFSALRAQTVPVEIVVVDSGSTDETCEVAERAGARLLHVERSEFGHGRTRNLAAGVAARLPAPAARARGPDARRT